jgi:MFS family permease
MSPSCASTRDQSPGNLAIFAYDVPYAVHGSRQRFATCGCAHVPPCGIRNVAFAVHLPSIPSALAGDERGAKPLAKRECVIRTDIPARLDRLPWSRWHWMVVIGLGITWILDGLEVTMVGNVGPRLQDRDTLGLSVQNVTLAASTYLLGAVLGALTFGYLTDRFGRKKLFLITLVWYLGATLLTALSWNFVSFAFFRFLTGFGIGGEYAAINSTIDELIPAARRGVVDIAINGTYWFGAILGSGATIVLLDPRVVDQRLGWRIAFGIGAVLAIAIVFVRRAVPESPRWLLTHGREAEAGRTMDAIEAVVAREMGTLSPPNGTLAIDTRRVHSLGDVWKTMIRHYPQRTAVAFALMIAQAFLYNAIFFTESLVLGTFFGVPAQRVGYYIFPFAVGNLLGPLLLGHLFDTIGRRTMIAGSYAFAGIALAVTGALFLHGALDATTITICWCVVFFVASAGASSAYLTASEIFPLEVRAMAIAIVYGIGTLAGGVLAPSLFGALIATKKPAAVVAGYGIAAVLMLAAAAIQWGFGIEAAGKRLEDVAAPLSATS